MVLIGKCSSHTTQFAEDKGRDWENEEAPTEGKDQVQDHLRNLRVHKSMRPAEMHPGVLRELADEVAKLLSIIFEKSWQSGEVHIDWKRRNITPFLRSRKKRRSVKLLASQSHLYAWQDPPRNYYKAHGD